MQKIYLKYFLMFFNFLDIISSKLNGEKMRNFTLDDYKDRRYSTLLKGSIYRDKHYTKEILNAFTDKENLLIAVCYDLYPNKRDGKNYITPKERYTSKLFTVEIEKALSKIETINKLELAHIEKDKAIKIAIKTIITDPCFFVLLFGARESDFWQENFEKIYNSTPEKLRYLCDEYGTNLFINTGKFFFDDGFFQKPKMLDAPRYGEFWV